MKFYEKSYNIMQTMIKLLKRNNSTSGEGNKELKKILLNLNWRVKDYKEESDIESEIDPEFDTFVSNMLFMARL